ncbi:tyrosine--tRNA ligase [Mycoplasmopsis pulmonis]|uniref:tyrosine--tRNA ligase n=1 Tax=Mycoplasmopsis pulmonis TaxID=2107 RepID=UPI0010052294|nr:tyrosine--tRNA ligase [Mycoplasmopsis pulmonis]VEU68251.1 tyrosyl tRNA synthetase [Mycoplasmopsis pulmonis]
MSQNKLKTLIEELKKRKVFNNITSEEKVYLITLDHGIYVGFDPTAISLHLGNYIQMVNLKRFQNVGFKTIAILGGATSMIGDPSFKDSERKLLSNETILENKKHIRKQLENFGFKVIDNLDFYKDMNILDYLRSVGKFFNVSTMMSRDSVANRIQSGLSFTEFSYQTLQAYDFKVLCEKENVMMQLGGSDQWGNLVSGLDFINKTLSKNLPTIGITMNLLVDSNGNKIGKSTGGASLWIDKTLTSPYVLYQYLLNTNDDDAYNLLLQLTFLQLSEIERIKNEHLKNPKLRLMQSRLSFEVVKDIHGKEEAQRALHISTSLFKEKNSWFNLSLEDLIQLKGSVDFVPFKDDLFLTLVDSKIISSKREFNEFVRDKSLKINGQDVTGLDYDLPWENYDNKYLILKKGKKQYWVIYK